MLLAICSRNDELIAKEPFEKNENMVLHLDDISCFVANWGNKEDNLHKIAHELNIGLDSLVFFDDTPAEREIVKQFVPEVHVVDVPDDPALFVLQMEKEQPFEWLQLTKVDLGRTDSYKGNQMRRQLQESFVDYNEYLKALDMKGKTDRLLYGMLTASFYSKLVGVYLPGEKCLFRECDVQWPKPVYIGDTLTVSGKVSEIDSRIHTVKIKASIRNQNGEKVSRATLTVGVLD